MVRAQGSMTFSAASTIFSGGVWSGSASISRTAPTGADSAQALFPSSPQIISVLPPPMSITPHFPAGAAPAKASAASSSPLMTLTRRPHSSSSRSFSASAFEASRMALVPKMSIRSEPALPLISTKPAMARAVRSMASSVSTLSFMPYMSRVVASSFSSGVTRVSSTSAVISRTELEPTSMTETICLTFFNPLRTFHWTDRAFRRSSQAPACRGPPAR